MNYQQTIEYLYSRLPMFSKTGGAALKSGLNNIRSLCNALGNPETQFRTIHIAGTNGKGSTSHMLSAILQQAGYKTGLYTSPHLYDFRERIRINGRMIPENTVTDFVQRIQPEITRTDPSFFEVTVAMAFEHFAAEKVDIAIIETGMGGRLDSTNIITPLLSMITNISFDHMQFLGNTLPLIAAEKAGIIKPGVPVIISETQAETTPVFRETAAQQKAAIYFADQHFRITANVPGMETLQLTVQEMPAGETRSYTLDLPGHYQQKNLPGVLQAVQLLRLQGWRISEAQLAAALRQVKRLTGMGGRWEVIGRQPYVVLDVAHNEAGIRMLLEQLSNVPYKKLHVVTGFVKDKDVPASLALLPTDAIYYFTKAQIPRAMDEQQLLELGRQAGLKGSAYPNVPEAYAAARAKAETDDLILVCGSFFIVGDMPRQERV